VFKKVINNSIQHFRSKSAPDANHQYAAKIATHTMLPNSGLSLEWGQPSPLPHAEPSPARYPMDCLAPDLLRVVQAIAEKTQAPDAIAAQSVLAAVSLTFASRAKVQTLGSNANAACYFVLVALSGERKSATDRLAMGGINRTVMELRQEYANLIKEHEKIIKSLGRDEAKPTRPACPNFLVTEPTIEGAFKAIASGAGFLGWFSDEAATFFGGHSMSADKMALTCGSISKFWDGAFFIRPRVTLEGDGYVPPTPTTLNLMFQPNLIRQSFGNEFMLGQGILARMLPAWPESNMGRRRYKQVDASVDAIVDEFQDATAKALRDTLDDPVEKMVTLSDAAFKECVAFHDDVEAELGRGKWAADISSFAAKAPEHACRLAAIMTLYETQRALSAKQKLIDGEQVAADIVQKADDGKQGAVFQDQDAQVISGSTMEKACRLVKYHLQQFKYLCVAGTNEDAVDHAQKLLDWLKSNLSPGGSFATERILQAGPVRTRNRHTMDKALKILEQHDWIAKLPDGTVVDNKPRRRAYTINPNA